MVMLAAVVFSPARLCALYIILIIAVEQRAKAQTGEQGFILQQPTAAVECAYVCLQC
jgi:hypothetical protein